MNLATLQILSETAIPDPRMRALVVRACFLLDFLTDGDTSLALDIVNRQSDELAMIGAMVDTLYIIEKRMN